MAISCKRNKLNLNSFLGKESGPIFVSQNQLKLKALISKVKVLLAGGVRVVKSHSSLGKQLRSFDLFEHARRASRTLPHSREMAGNNTAKKQVSPVVRYFLGVTGKGKVFHPLLLPVLVCVLSLRFGCCQGDWFRVLKEKVSNIYIPQRLAS